MAECRGRECVGCMDPRPQHGLELAFTASSAHPCPPAICTEGVVLNRLYRTVYATYFCKYAVGQSKDAFYVTGTRQIRYYVHCHCSQPGSLQCQAARRAMCELCRHMRLVVMSGNCVPQPLICCNSWLCVPIKCMGMVRSMYGHYFVFQMSEICSISSDIWKTRYRVEKVQVHEALSFINIYCDCKGPVGVCIEKCSAFYNYIRVIMCCCYDRFDFASEANAIRSREDFLALEAAPAPSVTGEPIPEEEFEETEV